MKEFEIELSNGIKIPAKLEYGELIYGVTAIAIGKNNNYINNNDVSTLTAKHPITGENIQIIILDDNNLQNTATLLVPAHIPEHFELAKKYNLPYKQVVAPYFRGTGNQTLRPDIETKFRRSVIAVIKNEKDYGIPIRIRSSTHNLLDIVSNETGWSKVDVITKMVEFAFDNIEWVPADEYIKDNGGNE
mgnify:CR=1 FL=1